MKHRTTCSLCTSPDLRSVLSLPSTSLANEFVAKEETKHPQSTFQLTLLICEKCEHVQLAEIVDPARLFRNYVYVSGTSRSFVQHFKKFADEMVKSLNLGSKDLVVDIGSNDGTMLLAFKERGCQILGVDPAEKIARAATAQGVPTICEFFTSTLAEGIVGFKGKARLVTANNVFAHAEDLIDITKGVSKLLCEDGVFTFEVSYLPPVMRRLLFDTIYHEHLDYHTIGPLIPFLQSHNLYLYDALPIDSHGGSIRIYAKKISSPTADLHPYRNSAVNDLVAHERRMKLDQKETWETFKYAIDVRGKSLRAAIGKEIEKGQTIAGFGAPAKLTTLMHTLNLNPRDFQYIIDDSPWKQGLYTPGMHIPVVSRKHFEEKPVDTVVLFAWNFAEQLVQELRSMANVIVPLPRLDHYPKFF